MKKSVRKIPLCAIYSLVNSPLVNFLVRVEVKLRVRVKVKFNHNKRTSTGVILREKLPRGNSPRTMKKFFIQDF